MNLAFDEENALKELLDSGYVFVNYRQFLCPYSGENPPTLQPPTLVVFVNCSDTFGYACSDAESISDSNSLKKLYEYFKKNYAWGVTQWAIETRKKKPIIGVQDMMKALGFWKEEYNNY